MLFKLGSDHDRGLLAWKQVTESTNESERIRRSCVLSVYNPPFWSNRISSYKCTKYIPFLPSKLPAVTERKTNL